MSHQEPTVKTINVTVKRITQKLKNRIYQIIKMKLQYSTLCTLFVTNEEKDRDQCRTCIGLLKIIIEDIHKSWLYCFTNPFKIPSLRGSVKHITRVVYIFDCKMFHQEASVETIKRKK